MNGALAAVKALTFDVFGTVVDWRGSIIGEGQAWGKERDIQVDWAAFAAAWRAGYAPAMDRVRRGELPWLKLDALHRMILETVLADFGLSGLSEAEKEHWNRVWHRLDPWPDVRRGLTRLRKGYTLATLSNGNLALLTNMAKRANLRWDCILSAELAQHYKPDPEVYLMAADLLGFAPHEVMMVAAHNGDLLAAQRVGMRTAFVSRPREHGPGQTTDLTADPAVDLAARDLIDLAEQLGV
ncbi:MAG TPA: haloacid dehalogenase type II [Caldilineaceae bacterium]|nr:haloacid dehalogenase type II [Caldilineaceae bacterium]